MIDAIITAIRESDSRAEARDKLMTAPFEFSDVQAEHILDMQLARLTRLGRADLEEEMAKLRQTIGELEALLSDQVLMNGVIKSELAEIKERFATPRLAQVIIDPGEMAPEDLIEDGELVITMSRAGYIKAVPASTYRTQGRGTRGMRGTNLREADIVAKVIYTTAHAYLLFFSNLGRVYRLRAYEVPLQERTSRGTAIVNLLPLDPGERIQALIDTASSTRTGTLSLSPSRGRSKRRPLPSTTAADATVL